MTALLTLMFSCNLEMTSFISSLRLLAAVSYGNMFMAAVCYSRSLNCFFASSPYPPYIATGSYLSSNLFPTPSTNFKKRSFFATKSVSQFTSSRSALVLHSLRKEATTPSLVYFYDRFSADASPLSLSHSMAFS